jgi:hypothetical protein
VKLEKEMQWIIREREWALSLEKSASDEHLHNEAEEGLRNCEMNFVQDNTEIWI